MALAVYDFGKVAQTMQSISALTADEQSALAHLRSLPEPLRAEFFRTLASLADRYADAEEGASRELGTVVLLRRAGAGLAQKP